MANCHEENLMIEGFETETAPLDNYEQYTLLPLIVEGLKKRVGEEMAAKGSYIVERLKEKGHRMSGARLRKIINHIRLNGLIPDLIASSNGYYVAKSAGEVQRFIESLTGRVDAIAAVRDSMRMHSRIMRRHVEEVAA